MVSTLGLQGSLPSLVLLTEERNNDWVKFYPKKSAFIATNFKLIALKCIKLTQKCCFGAQKLEIVVSADFGDRFQILFNISHNLCVVVVALLTDASCNFRNIKTDKQLALPAAWKFSHC